MKKFREFLNEEQKNIAGVPFIAGINKKLKNSGDYLEFSFDFYEDDKSDRPWTSAVRLNVYVGIFKLYIMGRSDFEKEVEWATKYRRSIISSELFKGVQAILDTRIILEDRGNDNGYYFETKIDEEQTDKLYKYLQSMYPKLHN